MKEIPILTMFVIGLSINAVVTGLHISSLEAEISLENQKISAAYVRLDTDADKFDTIGGRIHPPQIQYIGVPNGCHLENSIGTLIECGDAVNDAIGILNPDGATITQGKP